MADLLIKKIQIGNQAYSVYDERVQKPVPANAVFTDTTYTGIQGIQVTGTQIRHTNKVDAVSSSSLLKITYDDYGHITGSSAVTSDDIAKLGVSITDNNTTYKLTIGTTTNGDTEHGVDLGTLESKAATVNGTALSLVTTGEKAAWNAKTSNTGTVTSVSGTQGLTGSGNTTVTLKPNLNSYTPNSNAIGGKLYAVQLDKAGKLAVNVPWTDTKYSAEKGISLNGGKFGHSNTAITAVTTDAVFKKIKYDAYGHITGVVDVEKGDITALGIPGQDTTYTGEGGITVSNGKIKHTNSITAQTANAVFKRIKYDAQGHITGTEDVRPGDITPLIAGATGEITKLQTLVNSIKAELENPSAEGGLKSVLDTMQDILNSSANAVTGIKYTKQVLSVTDGVLSISDGGVTPTTAAFVTANDHVEPVTPKA